MSAVGLSARNAAIGAVQDAVISQPSGSGIVEITPTIPAAIAQTTRSSTTAPYYTKTSSSILVLTMAVGYAIGFTTGSKICVFWVGADGGFYWCSDCTITSIVGQVITITAPLATLTSQALAAGQLYFNGATTTGAGDVAGKKVNPGTTLVTFSVATIGTSDTPANPDLTSYSIPEANVDQLVLCAPGGTGAIQLMDSGPALLLGWNYSSAGAFFDSLQSGALTWSGTAVTLRFYNSSLSALKMKIGVLQS